MHFCGSYVGIPESPEKSKNPDFSVPRGPRTDRVVPLKRPWSIGQTLAGFEKIRGGDRNTFRKLMKLLIVYYWQWFSGSLWEIIFVWKLTAVASSRWGLPRILPFTDWALSKEVELLWEGGGKGFEILQIVPIRPRLSTMRGTYWVWACCGSL